MIRTRAENQQRKHEPNTVRGRLRLRPTVMALEGRTLLATIVVNNPTDTPVPGETDLRDAITQANTDGGDDTIVFSSVFNSPQMITLNGGTLELMDPAKTTITGPGADLLTVRGLGTNGPVFELAKGAVADLSGLTITGGYATDAGGGVFNDDGQLTMNNVVVRGNECEKQRLSPDRRRPGHVGRRHDHARELHDHWQHDLRRRHRRKRRHLQWRLRHADHDRLHDQQQLDQQRLHLSWRRP